MGEKEDFIRSFNEAFAKDDKAFILNSMSDNIVWNFVGEKIIEGKKEAEEFLQTMNGIETLEMELVSIVTHGRSAAANGQMKIKEPSGKTKSFGFADFYEFDGLKSPKIRKMTSYVVENKEEQNQ